MLDGLVAECTRFTEQDISGALAVVAQDVEHIPGGATPGALLEVGMVMIGAGLRALPAQEARDEVAQQIVERLGIHHS